MTRISLDELMTPTPPYRARRDVAVLAATLEEPKVAEVQKEISESERVADARTSLATLQGRILEMKTPEGLDEAGKREFEEARQNFLDDASARAKAFFDTVPMTQKTAKPALGESVAQASEKSSQPTTPKKESDLKDVAGKATQEAGRLADVYQGLKDAGAPRGEVSKAHQILTKEYKNAAELRAELKKKEEKMASIKKESASQQEPAVSEKSKEVISEDKLGEATARFEEARAAVNAFRGANGNLSTEVLESKLFEEARNRFVQESQKLENVRKELRAIESKNAPVESSPTGQNQEISKENDEPKHSDIRKNTSIRPQLRVDMAESQDKGMGTGKGAGFKEKKQKISSVAQPKGEEARTLPEVGSETIYQKPSQQSSSPETNGRGIDPDDVARVEEEDDFQGDADTVRRHVEGQKSQQEPGRAESPKSEQEKSETFKEESSRDTRDESKLESRRDSMGVVSWLTEGGRLVVEKSGTKPWLDTLLPRMTSVFHRRVAEGRMLQEVWFQGSLDRADRKVKAWGDDLKDGGWPMRLWYANRLRKWERRAGVAQKRVNKYDTLRLRWQERHNDLQRQVADRYDLELEAYRGIADELKSKEKGVVLSQQNLINDRKEALSRLAKAEAAGAGKWFMTPRARKAVNSIKGEIKKIDGHITRADKDRARIRAPLARAESAVDKWELKKKTVSELMEFPETAGLARRKRVQAVVPEREEVNFSTEAEPIHSESSSPAQESLKEKWSASQFAEVWSSRNLKPSLGNSKEFIDFVSSQRTEATQDPVLEDILNLAERYLKDRVSASEMKQFRKDKEFFVSSVAKKFKQKAA